MGTRNQWSDKDWRTALRLALKEKHEVHGTKLRALAEVCVDMGLAGDMSAITEVGNRLDGKASQPVEHSGHLDVSATLDRVITEMREREQSMRVDDAVRH